MYKYCIPIVHLESRDEDPTFFSTDPAQLEKYSGSNQNEENPENIFIF